MVFSIVTWGQSKDGQCFGHPKTGTPTCSESFQSTRVVSRKFREHFVDVVHHDHYEKRYACASNEPTSSSVLISRVADDRNRIWYLYGRLDDTSAA
jgi:hypothetical protein